MRTFFRPKKQFGSNFVNSPKINKDAARTLFEISSLVSSDLNRYFLMKPVLQLITKLTYIFNIFLLYFIFVFDRVINFGMKFLLMFVMLLLAELSNDMSSLLIIVLGVVPGTM